MAGKRVKRGFLWGCGILILISSMVTEVAAQNPNLIGAFFINGRVGLKWQEIDGAAQYNIYRKTGSDDFQKIDSVDKARYFDIDIEPGKTYIYKISVVGSDGKELFSDEKSVSIPDKQTGDFAPPTWSGLRLDNERIFLNWDEVPGAMAYNIYRSDISGSGYEVVGNTQGTKYADKNGLENGKTYYYVLTALNSDFDETAFSDEKSLKFGLSKAEMDSLLADQNKIVLENTKLTLKFEITDAGSSGKLNQPADIFINSKGNIYITDALNSKVHCYDKDGKYLFSFGSKTNSAEAENPPAGTFSVPFTLFIDKNDQVFVSDIENYDIQVFTSDGKFVKRIKVDTGTDQPFRANGMYVLDDGRIITTDTGNHRILIIDQDGNILKSVGKRGGENGEFVFPDGLTVSNGKIYVVDVINCRVQVFDLDLKFLSTFGHVGQEAGAFARPKEITADEKGRIWVSDGMSHMIQAFTPEGEVKTAVGSGVDERIDIATPRGIFFKNGNFYVVNRLPNKVAIYKIG